MKNLRLFLALLESKKQLLTIEEPVDPHLEIAEIHRRVVSQGGPALLFNRVKGSSFRVVTNLFGSEERVSWAFGEKVDQTIEQLLGWLHNPPQSGLEFCKRVWRDRSFIKRIFPLGRSAATRAPLFARKLESLDQLPFLTSWPLDGGPFLTLPLVYTESSLSGSVSDATISGKRASRNLGMYRIQRFGARQAGLHFQIGKGAGFHFWQAEEENRNLPVTILLGGPPALLAAAIAPLPEGMDEFLLASFLMQGKIACKKRKNWPHLLPVEAEFAICGEALHGQRRLEGPFGDHYGYYSLAHPFPLLEVKHIFARSDAIYPATIVGKPPQEDFYIGQWLQKTMRPLLRFAMPAVEDFWAYAESGFHAVGVARIRERYEREALQHALRILGEGQLSFTKCLFLTDQKVPLHDFKKVLEQVLERLRPECDLYILGHMSLDTLDYTGHALNQGSRAIFLGLGQPKRDLPHLLDQRLQRMFPGSFVFCPGTLVVKGTTYREDPRWAENLLERDLFPWTLIVVVDDPIETCRSSSSFLWTVFMRFDPAQDLCTRHHLVGHHLCHDWPLVIDARMKPKYPQVVEVDPTTQALVTEKWNRYFKEGSPF